MPFYEWGDFSSSFVAYVQSLFKILYFVCFFDYLASDFFCQCFVCFFCHYIFVILCLFLGFFHFASCAWVECTLIVYILQNEIKSQSIYCQTQFSLSEDKNFIQHSNGRLGKRKITHL